MFIRTADMWGLVVEGTRKSVAVSPMSVGGGGTGLVAGWGRFHSMRLIFRDHGSAVAVRRSKLLGRIGRAALSRWSELCPWVDSTMLPLFGADARNRRLLVFLTQSHAGEAAETTRTGRFRTLQQSCGTAK